MIYIPLGMRCNTAAILRYYLGMIKISLPFDWTQMTAPSMVQWIINRPDKYFLEKYFEGFTNNKNELGDWFPHETFWNEKAWKTKVSEF